MNDAPRNRALTEAAATDESRTRRRIAPVLLGGLVLLLLSVLIAQQVSGLWEVVTPDTAADTLLLYALSSLIFVSFIVFTFIFVRSLVKLRRERRARELGSKIKTRLVVYFITVSLLPITAMAVFSYFFLNRSLEKWFSRLPEDVVNEARLAQNEQTAAEKRRWSEIATLAARLVDEQMSRTKNPDLNLVARQWQFELLAIVAADSTTVDASAGQSDAGAGQSDAGERGVQPHELTGVLDRLRSSGEGFTDVGANGNFDAAVIALSDGQRLIAVRRKRGLNTHLNRIVAGSETYQELRKEQRKVRLLGLSTLGLLTLMLLFAATWAAIHLARGIALPIRALAEAADEVASGNLAHRVATVADDELALLAESFNQMTAQLEENRRRIEATAHELQDKNLALQERRDYIETVLESLSAGVISLDLHNRVTTINAAAMLMLRLSSIPPTKAMLSEVVSVEDHAILERVLRRARRVGRAAEQMELVRNGGGGSGGGGSSNSSQEDRAIPVALTATALSAQADEGCGVVLVIEDLSELLAAQRAAAWSEVARRMAHEIKNPLTPIQLSAERIARNFAKSFDGQDQPHALPQPNGEVANGHAIPAEREHVRRVISECTTTITREVASLKAMVDEFSRFARLPHAHLEAADLNEVVRQAVSLYEDRLNDMRVDVHLARTLPAAMLDVEQLRRAFVNLIDNAVEALGEIDGERRITIATAHDPSRGLLLTEIADLGHGIASADFPRLFQPYFSTRGRGTGLGLAIVQRIITDHSGRIRAEANRPRGARFIIELPVATA